MIQKHYNNELNLRWQLVLKGTPISICKPTHICNFPNEIAAKRFIKLVFDRIGFRYLFPYSRAVAHIVIDGVCRERN